jgi:hypothetical protein
VRTSCQCCQKHRPCLCWWVVGALHLNVLAGLVLGMQRRLVLWLVSGVGFRMMILVRGEEVL